VPSEKSETISCRPTVDVKVGATPPAHLTLLITAVEAVGADGCRIKRTSDFPDVGVGKVKVQVTPVFGSWQIINVWVEPSELVPLTALTMTVPSVNPYKTGS
jgi:hypothetical protein